MPAKSKKSDKNLHKMVINPNININEDIFKVPKNPHVAKKSNLNISTPEMRSSFFGTQSEDEETENETFESNEDKQKKKRSRGERKKKLSDMKDRFDFLNKINSTSTKTEEDLKNIGIADKTKNKGISEALGIL